MGHREDLLEGAKQCLIERGYSQTTARDIVVASNTNLGSIGYHYGTKEKLLMSAMLEMSGELGDKMLAVGVEAGEADERLRAFWEGMIDSFCRNHALWKANIEILAQTLRDDDVRSQLAEGQERARNAFGEILTPDAGDDRRAAGSVQFALITGVMVQHLLDPGRAPGADEVVRGLRAIAENS